MHTPRRRRLLFIIVLLTCLSSASALALYALRQNITLYYTPTELLSQSIAASQDIRLGGIVVAHSVKRVPNSLSVTFTLTDFKHQIIVHYKGILPSLFREGQGIVAEGKLTSAHVFMADQVLAKHDENYHPPGISSSSSGLPRGSSF